MRHSRRRPLLLTFLGASALAAGCGEAPTDTLIVSGTYQLQAISQRDLPAMAYNAAGTSLEIEGGTLRFDPDSARGVDYRHVRCPTCDPVINDSTPRAYTQGYRQIAGNTIVLSSRTGDGIVIADTAVLSGGQLIFPTKWLGLRIGGQAIRTTAVYAK